MLWEVLPGRIQDVLASGTNPGCALIRKAGNAKQSRPKKQITPGIQKVLSRNKSEKRNKSGSRNTSGNQQEGGNVNRLRHVVTRDRNINEIQSHRKDFCFISFSLTPPHFNHLENILTQLKVLPSLPVLPKACCQLDWCKKAPN